MKNTLDPMADALWDYFKSSREVSFEVSSDISLPETMLASYFFRSYQEMNLMEKYVMNHVSGKTLDMGAGAGCHSKYLQEKGLHIECLESSSSLSDLLKARGLTTIHTQKWQDWNTDLRYDSIFLLMNGAGMAETLDKLPELLIKLKSLLNEGGRIWMDSSDISYLYEMEDGSIVMDLGGSYPGEIVYTVTYNKESASFPWLFVKQEDLKRTCEDVGLNMKVVATLEESFLAEISYASPGIPSSFL